MTENTGKTGDQQLQAKVDELSKKIMASNSLATFDLTDKSLRLLQVRSGPGNFAPRNNFNNYNNFNNFNNNRPHGDRFANRPQGDRFANRPQNNQLNGRYNNNNNERRSGEFNRGPGGQSRSIYNNVQQNFNRPRSQPPKSNDD